MQKKLGEKRRAQGGKQERTCHFVLELNVDARSAKMGKEAVVGSTIMRHLGQTKAKMAMFKAKKATAKEAH
jgi:hypothetical protein